MNKLISIEEAVSKVKDGDTIMVGGFGLVGAPLTLIEGLIHKDVKNLTVISNNLGEPGRGLGIVVNQNKIKKGKANIIVLFCPVDG